MTTSRLGRSRLGGASRVVGAAGTVAAAAAAHVSAGGARPTAGLLFLLVAVLAVLARHAPGWLRSGRTQLAAAALLQPVLHMTFDLFPASGPAQRAAAAGVAVMLLAHGLAAVFGAWWLVRGADRSLVAVSAMSRRIRVRLSAVGLRPVHRPGLYTPPVVIGFPVRQVLIAVPRRGPPSAVVR